MKNKKLLLLLLFTLIVLSIYAVFFLGGTYLDRSLFDLIIYKVRLPRVLVAIAVGGALAVSGLIMQTIFSNVLAEPYILGTSSVSAFTIVVVMSLGFSSFYVMFFSGFLGALLSILLLMILFMKKNIAREKLLVFGIIVQGFFSALIMVVLSFSNSSSLVLNWLMGSVAGRSLPVSIISIVLSIVCMLGLLINYNKLDIMSFGKEHSISIGLNYHKYMLFFLVLSALLAGLCVSISGIIGFVGIVIPNIVKEILGSGKKKLIVNSWLGGALFLLMSDCFLRLFFNEYSLPVGVVTAFWGSPFFIWILLKRGDVFDKNK